MKRNTCLMLGHMMLDVFLTCYYLRSRLECRLRVPDHCLQSNGVIIHMTSRTSATRFDFSGRDVKNTNSRYDIDINSHNYHKIDTRNLRLGLVHGWHYMVRDLALVFILGSAVRSVALNLANFSVVAK